MESLTLESATESAPSRVARWLPRLHVKAFTGGLIVLTFIVVGILGPALAPHNPNKQELTAMTKAPQGIGSLHVLGTDNLGRDVFSRVIYGARVSLLVAFAVVFVSGLIGISLGAISGYFGGKTDFIIQKLVEVVWAFPPLLLGITIMAFLGQGLFNLILALVVQRWIPYCRVVRGQTLSLRTREFVVASQCLGARNAQIILRHIIPNVIQTSLSPKPVSAFSASGFHPKFRPGARCSPMRASTSAQHGGCRSSPVCASLSRFSASICSAMRSVIFSIHASSAPEPECN
jgi:ABC-type dipeptide/oligopeptide/nickel transport system permease subunit